MSLVIDGKDFNELESERYWSFPSSYSQERKKQEIKNFIFSDNYLGSRKVDGAYYRFIKDLDGEIYLQGRNRGVKGDFLNKVEWVPHLNPFFNQLPKGTCLLGEIYTPENPISPNVTKIMGCLVDKAISRQSKHKLHYYIFDIWAFGGISFLKKEAAERFRALRDLPENPYIEVATYSKGKVLWDQLGSILESGGEGIVITLENSLPGPGARTARKTLKIKKEFSENLDCVIIGANAPTVEYGGNSPETWNYWLNQRTGEKKEGKFYRDAFDGAPLTAITKAFFHGWAGSLQLGLYKDGKMIQIGSLSGVTEEILENWRDYLHQVVEVNVMEILPTGGLRHPRFVKFRPDKNPKDCRWEQYFE